ncbi:serine hydrolase [Streptomyces caniscabiei]|uniref:serine hydrolase domain-containing protein n=1 Tax=Streptomyces caniscabiei TaxID=2746961 RepID=UPI0029B52969|nr:serine hydrolase domain-containing protein [Streptomyces caniscabiei]MDX2602039.1 serine hydrolase [Streptomyces caniscabiei]MDX2737474.1 serine hydrolase [Streptomyces caniscabiei]MDX2779820.1 serine hydrolase [Streptomyces caniscabiei]
MRRTPSRRPLAAALLVASVLAPIATAPVTAVHAAVGRYDEDRYDKGRYDKGRYDKNDCPRGGLGRELTARLDEAVEGVRREAGIPGVTVGLWMPDRGCYVRSTGVADTVTRRPMTPDLFLRIGSETKTFTATALLRLVDDRRVRLDDPISRYVRGVPNGHRITLRHLAQMRSGLFPYSADPGFVHDLLSDPSRSFTPRELLAYAFRHPNVFAPGEEFQYSNTNFVLLGLVVEKVGGKRFADFLRERVLRPAGLRRTLFPEGAGSREFPEPHARGYTNQTLSGEVEDATDWNPSWAWAAGAMISELRDLRRWAEVVATGTLLSPRTQRERLMTLPTGFPGTSYGLGILETGGWIGHNGSIPGYQSVTVHLPARKATLVLLLNTDVPHEGQEPSSLLARSITEIVTPGNVYDRPASPR